MKSGKCGRHVASNDSAAPSGGVASSAARACAARCLRAHAHAAYAVVRRHRRQAQRQREGSHVHRDEASELTARRWQCYSPTHAMALGPRRGALSVA